MDCHHTPATFVKYMWDFVRKGCGFRHPPDVHGQRVACICTSNAVVAHICVQHVPASCPNLITDREQSSATLCRVACDSCVNSDPFPLVNLSGLVERSGWFVGIYAVLIPFRDLIQGQNDKCFPPSEFLRCGIRLPLFVDNPGFKFPHLPFL